MLSAQNRVPDRPGADDPGRGRRIGIDVGTVRIGVAVSDPDGILATPVETVRRDRTTKHLRRLAALVEEYEAVEVVVGLPRTLADRAGASAQDAIAVADALAAKTGIPVRLADERLTTVSASRSLREAGMRHQSPAHRHRPSRRRCDPAGLARSTSQRGAEPAGEQRCLTTWTPCGLSPSPWDRRGTA